MGLKQVDDPTECAHPPEPAHSLWTAPQSRLYPTVPATSPTDLLSAFYTRPPTQSTIQRGASAEQRAKFFRRVTKDDALEPSHRQNLLTVLGALLATGCGTYMVLFADFGQAGATNCFTDLRSLIWGPQGPPSLLKH